MTKPILHMLIGLPCSGKTSYALRMPPYRIVSTDDIIAAISYQYKYTYDECFRQLIDFATLETNRQIDRLIKQPESFVWDQTNLTKKSRAKKLNRFSPSVWQKNAYFFHTPDEKEWKRRLSNRPGKTIPPHILKQMQENMEQPEKDEGFDMIYFIHAKEGTDWQKIL